MRYSINQRKLAEVVAIVRDHRVAGVSEVVACSYARLYSDGYQQWLEDAPAGEIAGRMLAKLTGMLGG